MKNKKTLSIFNLYLIYGFDLAATVIVFVIFTPLLFNPESHFVSSSLSIAQKNVLLGFLFAAYPLCQFIGSPVFGDLSDHFGRRKILLISTFMTALTFILSAASIEFSSIVGLFIGRMLGGFFAGNASLAQATVSDLSSEKRRSQFMALFSVVGGLSWILGPFIGGFFSNSNILPWFNFSTPFWLLSLLFLLFTSIAAITLDGQPSSKFTAKLSIARSFKNILSVVHVKILRIPFVVSFLTLFAWMIVQSYSAPYLTVKFSFSQHTLTFTYAYYSLFWLLGGVFSMLWFKKRPAGALNAIAMALIPLFILGFALSQSPHAPFWYLPLANILMSVSMSAFMAIFSHLVSADIRGKVFGAYWALVALAAALAPAFSGWISKYLINLPFLISSATFLVAVCCYIYWLRANRLKLNKV